MFKVIFYSRYILWIHYFYSFQLTFLIFASIASSHCHVLAPLAPSNVLAQSSQVIARNHNALVTPAIPSRIVHHPFIPHRVIASPFVLPPASIYNPALYYPHHAHYYRPTYVY